jgi:GNAT superfamily N-acetyltransferase
MKLKKTLYQLVNGTVYVQAPLKAFELNEQILEEKYGLRTILLDHQSAKDIDIWRQIIHSSYDDCYFTPESAYQLLTNHPYFSNVQTFVFQEINGDGYAATISIGEYKQNPTVGGDFRVGVTHKYQRKGYGRLCVLFAFSKLSSRGLKSGESAIALKRRESLHLHYSLGFRPQTNCKYLACKNSNWRVKNLNFILKIRQYATYRDFLLRERKKYL